MTTYTITKTTEAGTKPVMFRVPERQARYLVESRNTKFENWNGGIIFKMEAEHGIASS